MRRFTMSLLLGVGIMATSHLHGDEGMWLFNQAPKKLLQDKYQFDATDVWLDHLRQAAVRFNSGGSGSFISADGLVITNHHVGADALQKLSDAQADYTKIGFLAKSDADEIKCVDLELNVLTSIEDVTDAVKKAVPAGATGEAAQKARRAVMNELEKASLDKTGLRSDVITLYQGGAYHLYRYKKYTDVRLVFAPEQDIAFFGGDPDNFEYPRYDLDVCFFRVYENGKPAKIEHHLQWSAKGCKDGDLVFVAGNPGKTDRLNTLAHLRLIRDRIFPLSLQTLFRREVLLDNFSERLAENRRRAQEENFSIKNTRKARIGALASLQDPALLQQKETAEIALRQAVAAGTTPELKACAMAWDEVDKATALWNTKHHEYYFWEGPGGFNSHLFHIARLLVRKQAESAKSNSERLREYADAGRESLELDLYSPAPIYSDFETLKLADSLTAMLEIFGSDDALLKQVLAGKSPRERAAEIVSGSKIAEVAVRKTLGADDGKALAASKDPMIELARLVDERGRAIRKTYETEIEEPLRQAYGKIAQAQFALHGADQYPDATFSLRLAFGTVKGYEENGQKTPALTTLGGAYEHSAKHGGAVPFALPKSWHDKKSQLQLDTPFNFVSTCDIIGGNSGSPVVNRAGEFVGIIFDGNIQSLVADFVYTDVQGRALSVHSAGILEAVKKVYGADTLAKEIETGKR
jgi:hypothetical protein